MSTLLKIECKICHVPTPELEMCRYVGKSVQPCKKCYNTRRAEWRAKNPERMRMQAEKNKLNPNLPAIRRRATIKHRYGITQEEYLLLWEKQSGACAICKTPEAFCSRKKLVVDHDHGTGKVRGLLCTPCNLTLGYLRDDPKLLASAIAYLVNPPA